MTERKSTWLLDHKQDLFSQTGEDGVFAEVLSLLPEKNHWCVEFGAWDGKLFSNTANLIENRGYSAVLIEADSKKFLELQQYCQHKDNVVAINRIVGFGQDDNLDEILSTTPIPLDFDFLSVDIDGNDYHAWRAISRYRPKVVVIEFNPTIPSHVRSVQPADPSCHIGSSLLAMVQLAKEKGYELVCALHFNAIFVKQEYFPLFEIKDNDPATLWQDQQSLTYLCAGYDGTIFLVGGRRLLWHDIELFDSRLQYLPKWLRKFPPNYTKLEAAFFKLFKSLINPQC